MLDPDTSPLVDLGDPATPIGAEPGPNGGRVNAGAFGGKVAGSSTPATIAIFSGNNQTGLPGQALALPLEVRVSSGAYSEPGVVVSFSAPPGGSVVPIEMPTDVNGHARTTASLGAAGPNSFTVVMKNLAALGSVTFNATAVGAQPDGGNDAGSGDAGAADAGGVDAGTGDAGSVDAGNDSGVVDGGGGDAGNLDGGEVNPGADGGLPTEPLHLAVGCDCATSSGSGLLVLVLGVVAALRRRRG